MVAVTYIWTNEYGGMTTERIIYDTIITELMHIPYYMTDKLQIVPHDMFADPFNDAGDVIATCDIYLVDSMGTYTICIDKRREFDEYVRYNSNPDTYISQEYSCEKSIFVQMRKICSKIGIDIYCTPTVYNIYTHTQRFYASIWVCRYVLYTLAGNAIVKLNGIWLIKDVDDNISSSFEDVRLNLNVSFI
uniref:Uncharacterized protein n=1 Tax=viral metagenome TaxID=1070528 RepID=A0A6C0BSY2_9ZZZZ